jgi:hypothetical protein
MDVDRFPGGTREELGASGLRPLGSHRQEKTCMGSSGSFERPGRVGECVEKNPLNASPRFRITRSRNEGVNVNIA